MEIIDNIRKTLKDDLIVELHEGRKLSIAASCFSIYAFQELKKQLKDIDELRFIFTFPTFITEKASKQNREFYIPRINREHSLNLKRLTIPKAFIVQNISKLCVNTIQLD